MFMRTMNPFNWSNSKFKLCLKVAEPADSRELLKTTDAAYIVEPGRGYLKVGTNELYELFQSGYSGAPYSKGDSSSKDEAYNTKASYISKRRIRLAQELSSYFYAEVLALGGWHSNLVTQIQEQDSDIANAIERSREGN